MAGVVEEAGSAVRVGAESNVLDGIELALVDRAARSARWLTQLAVMRGLPAVTADRVRAELDVGVEVRVTRA